MLLTSRKTGRKIAANKFIGNKRLEGRNRMKRTLVVMSLLAVVGVGGCNSTTSNNSANVNSNTAPANVGVVQNNNGNQNTSGVRPINSNNANSSPNNNASPGNRNN